MYQGSGCSPSKDLRELGSKRRETVWPLSVVTLMSCGESLLVRKDRSERTSDVGVVMLSLTSVETTSMAGILVTSSVDNR